MPHVAFSPRSTSVGGIPSLVGGPSRSPQSVAPRDQTCPEGSLARRGCVPGTALRAPPPIPALAGGRAAAAPPSDVRWSQSGHHRRSRRIADRRGTMRVREQHSTPSQPVDIRSMHLTSITAQTSDPVVHVVYGDEQNIRSRFCDVIGRSRKSRFSSDEPTDEKYSCD